MGIPLYTRVRLETDRYAEVGARSGMLGYVIEAYPDGRYEVELSDSEGVTIAQVVVREHEIASTPEPRLEYPQ